MRALSSFFPGRGKALLGLAVLSWPVLASAPAALADDRDLLRDTTGKPYVFILLDTSGSMNWTPKCTQTQFNAGDCDLLCPYGECFTPLQADDPSSKFYQAKEALYEVLKDVNDVNFGFATFNQDRLFVETKHWLYKPATAGVTLPASGSAGAMTFPVIGAEEVFGKLLEADLNCDPSSNANNSLHRTGCYSNVPANTNDAWSTARVRRLPKGGQKFNEDLTFYIRHGNNRYRVRYRPVTGPALGASQIQLKVKVDRCTDSNGTGCNSTSALGEPTVTFDVARLPNGAAKEFLVWDVAGNTPITTHTQDNPSISFFPQNLGDHTADGNSTCLGWDPNNDVSSDNSPSNTATPRYNWRWPTTSTDPRGSLFTVGDVVPLDWQTDHKADVLRRLAPNVGLGATTPDFRTASYMQNLPLTGETFLRLKDEAARPFVASGATPLGFSVKSFRTWYSGCATGNCPNGSGWKHFAGAADPDWGCRKKFLLILTDGDDTCPGADPCTGTAGLRSQEGVLTYVVAFGVENKEGNKLNCMAANGGTDAPIYPQNKQELIDALTNIFGQIREQTSTFASAAVPTVQAEVADKIYISNFTPLNGASVWDGHVDAYLKPLPLTPSRTPDRNKACPPVGSANRGSCHLWDAGEVLVGQAPDEDDLQVSSLTASVLRLGLNTNQRRVFYGKTQSGNTIPTLLQLFAPPTLTSDWLDLFQGFKIASGSSPYTAAIDRSKEIFKTTLQIKEETVQLANQPARDIRYVLGDTFHADPVIVDRPSDFDRFSIDLYGNGDPWTCPAGDRGYRCFVKRHEQRRKMLAVASNDGQLHFFDAGIWEGTLTKGKFNDGTGTELFSFIPRLSLPVLRDLAETSKQIFGLDSTPRIEEAFIDPEHTGTPNASEREWRTVLLGGFREGGDPISSSRMLDFVSGYYALDLTQPDTLNSSNLPPAGQVIPTCLSLDNQVKSGCSTRFPSLLWEFTDSLLGARMDEDDNGYPDLGETWSVPTVGRIKVLVNNAPVDKYVAIFGGGMDADSKSAPRRGNWLYIVDIETGKTLYKRRLQGSVPADPAVVDSNSDGYLDTIYVVTTAGYVYKTDISTAAALETVTLQKKYTIPDLAADTQIQRITHADWEPFPIFDTLGKPIYFAPTALFVSKLNTVALAFGTGDREDLWNLNLQEGRFYMVVDESYRKGQAGLPKNESQFKQITPAGASAAATANFVLTPDTGKSRGWYMRLEANERIIAPTFGLLGLVSFSTYEPQIRISGNNNTPVCGRTGTSRFYTVFADNANAMLQDADGDRIRYREVPIFVAPPTVATGQTGNPSSGGRHADQLQDFQMDIMTELKRFCPPGSKFGNYWYSVSAMGADVTYQDIAAVPVCILQKNWKTN
ncbi:MAG TPA: hypothetical protein VMW27_12295 [Thermoanaerobaculia bacterium]|nr:hypothetical protein [Thermoanaerobaculia bacterium]